MEPPAQSKVLLESSAEKARLRRCLHFLSDRKVEVIDEPCAPLEPGRVRVRSIASAISTGTELLVYRGDVSREIPVDEALLDLPHRRFKYPLKYGYTTVGCVEEVGDGVEPGWLGRQVFAFHPHESRFQADPAGLLPLPEGLPVEDALFLPSMETAVNLILDGEPGLGERVVVFGLGIIGVLTTALLARFPLAGLVGLDPFPQRRDLDLGATALLDPSGEDYAEQVRRAFGERDDVEGADLVYELSGQSDALDQAIAVTGYHGRLVIGSWYGEQEARLHLGGRFHRSRIKLVVSQVSSIAPEHRGRWSRQRRFEAAWRMIRELHPSRFITHRFPIERAGEAYHLLDRNQGDALVTILTY